MARVGLQHRRAELDARRLPAGDGDGHERVAGDHAGVPERGEAVGLCLLRLRDDLVDRARCRRSNRCALVLPSADAVRLYNHAHVQPGASGDMDIEAQLDDLRRDVQYLKDRSEILDCIARHARGCDRHDVELLTSTYHDDGVDEHGATLEPRPRVRRAGRTRCMPRRPRITCTTSRPTRCEIDGDEAHAESYVLVTMLTPDRSTATLLSGRYLDRLERRDGAWRIAVRRSTVELCSPPTRRCCSPGTSRTRATSRATRERTDPSYACPLSVETPATRW